MASAYWLSSVRIRSRNTRHNSGRLSIEFGDEIETTINQLNDQFHLCRIRARNHWGMLTRIIDKLAGFSLSVLLNRSLGRPLMETKDLVFA